MSKQKDILVAVLGSTPQILTETLWYLKKEKGIEISEVFVITTSLGKKLICEGNPSTGLPPLLNGVFEKFCEEFGMKTKFNEGNIRVIKDENGVELEDIRDDEQNEIAANFIINEIRKIIKRKNAVLHCSIAGGRKTMSVYASLAMTLVGRKKDKLYHVLVSPPEIEGVPKFFYKPEKPIEIELKNGKISTDEINITLAEIPFLRLGERYGNIFPDDITYTELVDRIQRYINVEKPSVHGISGEPVEIIGENESFKKALRDLERYAKNKAVKIVLLVGELGTGKELFARRFHEVSDRNKKSFEAVNCAAFSEGLIESELFGYVKGAFTGAVRDKKGIIEECDGGTLFLDEINKTTKGFQSKLLRFIEYGEFRPVGSSKAKRVDVRIVIGLNQDPEEWLKDGEVLSDFYSRITRHQVKIPPLRDRKDDIPILVDFFIKKYSAESGKNIKGISEEVMDMLLAYDWNIANVRELESAIADMIARADENEEIITNPPENLKLNVEAQDKVIEEYVEEISGGGINLTLDEFERRYIEYKLRKSNYNISKTARDLGLKRSTLQSKMKKLGVILPKYRR
ncbi:MAG: CRISPR-associated ring nuclease Csm6 [Candidatus Kryptonium sp.]